MNIIGADTAPQKEYRSEAIPQWEPTMGFRMKPDGLQQLWRYGRYTVEWRYVKHVGEDAPDNEIGEV